MCAGAIVQSRVKRVVYGADDPKAGAVRSLYQLLEDSRLNHRAEVTAGVMAEECGQVLSQFFKQKRIEKK
jgi:tRNA(adenine34) deaminase